MLVHDARVIKVNYQSPVCVTWRLAVGSSFYNPLKIIYTMQCVRFFPGEAFLASSDSQRSPYPPKVRTGGLDVPPLTVARAVCTILPHLGWRASLELLDCSLIAL